MSAAVSRTPSPSPGAAGEEARGSTLYVNLEACSHVGRTPPCVDAILAAGVGASSADDRSQPDGERPGVARLRDADRRGRGTVRGRVGTAQRRLRGGAAREAPSRDREARDLADGRIANAEGQSAWISGEEARAEVHQLRAHADAVLVGPGTLRADRPRLTARGTDGQPLARQPRRVVIDPRLDAPLALELWDTSVAPTWVACSEDAPEAQREALGARGVKVLVLPSCEGKIDEAALLAALFEDGCISVLCEGGGGLAARLLEEGARRSLGAVPRADLVGRGGRAECRPPLASGDGGPRGGGTSRASSAWGPTLPSTLF